SSLDVDVARLADRSILIATRDQLTTALALIELDGVARRLTLLPPDLPREHVPAIAAKAEVDAAVGSEDTHGNIAAPLQVICRPPRPGAPRARDGGPTEWFMLTSGTSGAPKMGVHSLPGLPAAITRRERDGETIVWSPFYDIRRYGGLQILLRAILDGGSMVLS